MMRPVVIFRVFVWMTICWPGLHLTGVAADRNGSAMELELSAEVLALRAEVRELRADIHRLIEHLQTDQTEPRQDKAGQTEPSLLSNASTPKVQKTAHDKIDFIDLTLENCIALALQNAELEGKEFNRLNLLKDVHDAYWDLWAATKRLDVIRGARDSSLNLWRLSADYSKVSGRSIGAEAQSRALYKQFESNMHTATYGSTVPGNDPQGVFGRENLLREKIGLRQTDERMIRPRHPLVVRVD